MTYGLGRIHAPDLRDLEFPMAAPVSTRTSRFWWAYKVRLDQGQTPRCVAFAWSHFIVDSPTTHPAPLVDPDVLYHEAQTLDEWPGEDYEGTSVRGGVKALSAHAEISEYRWATDINTIAANILEVGPVIVGTNCYTGFFNPDSNNYVHLTGIVEGGHAYKLDGVNVPMRFFRIKNSWGSSWGRGGFARISFDDMARLLTEDGEACLAIETV
jgi:hypothetical protein